MLRALALGLLLWAAPLHAQSERIVLEWDRWLEAQGNPDGALVFLIEDSELLAAQNGIPADQPLPLASNSKAITALCAQALVDEGRMTWQDRLGDWIEGGGEITLAELVTHTSGLWPDQTQGAMPVWRNDTTRRWQEVTDTALSRAEQQGTRGSYQYNNENCAILGLVIEEAGDGWYEDVCTARVTAPLGLHSARLSPEYGGYGPWGGWQMSVRDYARFMRQAVIDRDPLATPHVDLGGGVYYGLGMLFRTGRGAPNYWHFGALCFEDAGLGAYAVNWAGKYTLVAGYSACVDGDAMAALDRAMVKAVFSD